MFLRALPLLVLLLVPFRSSAVTVEVVQLFQPLSLHGSDGAGEEEDGKEALQAAVLPRPMAISGAIPEDLVKAIALPHKIASNSPAYVVEDANLLTLCKVTLTAEMKNEKLLIRIDVTNLTIPEEVDLTSRQVLHLTISAIQRTLKGYYRGGEEMLEVSVGVIGTNEGNESLKELSLRFTVGA